MEFEGIFIKPGKWGYHGVYCRGPFLEIPL